MNEQSLDFRNEKKQSLDFRLDFRLEANKDY